MFEGGLGPEEKSRGKAVFVWGGVRALERLTVQVFFQELLSLFYGENKVPWNQCPIFMSLPAIATFNLSSAVCPLGLQGDLCGSTLHSPGGIQTHTDSPEPPNSPDSPDSSNSSSS